LAIEVYAKLAGFRRRAGGSTEANMNSSDAIAALLNETIFIGSDPARLWLVAIASTVWGDLFNRPVCGVVRLGNVRE